MGYGSVEPSRGVAGPLYLDYDELLAEIGEFGWFQRLAASLLWVPAAVGGIHVLMYSFTGDMYSGTRFLLCTCVLPDMYTYMYSLLCTCVFPLFIRVFSLRTRVDSLCIRVFPFVNPCIPCRVLVYSLLSTRSFPIRYLISHLKKGMHLL